MLRLNSHTFTADKVIAKELVNNLLKTDFKQELVRFNFLQDCQISHSLDHALDIAMLFKVEVEAEVSDKTAVLTNLILEVVWTLSKLKFVNICVSYRCDTSNKKAGSFNKPLFVVPVAVFLFRYLHQLHNSVYQVFMVDQFLCTVKIIFNDQSKCEK